MTRYTEPDCLSAHDDVDSAAVHMDEHREHRRRYPRFVSVSPEDMAEIEEVLRQLRSGELDRKEHEGKYE